MRKKHSPLTYLSCAIVILTVGFTFLKLWKLLRRKDEISD